MANFLLYFLLYFVHSCVQRESKTSVIFPGIKAANCLKKKKKTRDNTIRVIYRFDRITRTITLWFRFAFDVNKSSRVYNIPRYMSEHA